MGRIRSTCTRLIVYGENGSGKTSLYEALRRFLESSEGGHQFKPQPTTIFNSDDGNKKLHLRTAIEAVERLKIALQ